MLLKLIKRILAWAWLIPGFLLWAAYPPMAERFDCFFALAPLLWLARNRGVTLRIGERPKDEDRRGAERRALRKNTWLWFVNGFLFWFATLSWMPAIVKNNGPWPLVALGWGALAAYCALFFAAFGWLSARYWRWAAGKTYFFRLVGLVVVEPVLWCGLELLRSRLFGGFSWNQLGVAPLNAGFGAPAALGGIYLVSAVVILVNGTLASIAERFIAIYRARCAAEDESVPAAVPQWVRSVETFLPFALILSLYQLTPVVSHGSDAADNRTIEQSNNPADNQTIKQSNNQTILSVALVQRNFPCCFKPQDRENPYEVYSNLCSNVAYLKPDLVVLSESALCEFGAVDHPRSRYFADYLMRLTGARAVLAGGGRCVENRAYNSAALYTASERIDIYDKVHLVPFGEFIPGDKWFPALQKLAPVGSCTPGELRLLELPARLSNRAIEQSEQSNIYPISLGVAICYEDTDSALVRAMARKGAQALVFITNDSWFSYSQEAVSHAWQATARAIETGLPVIRVGNSGVTGVILPDGSANWLCGTDGRPLLDAKGTLFDRLELPVGQSAATPYCRLGDWPLGIAFGLLITAMFLIYYKNIYEKRRTLSLQVR